MYSLFAVIAVCVIVVIALLFVVHKHRQSKSVATDKTHGAGANAFSNPLYESQTTADYNSDYMQVDEPM